MIGSLAVIWLGEFLRNYMKNFFTSMTSEVEAVFFGIIIIVVLIFMPDGLTGWINRIPSWGKRLYERKQTSNQ